MRSNPGGMKWFMFILVSSILAGGCEKIIDQIHKNGKGDTDYKACSIRQITFTSPTSDESSAFPAHYNFTYNKLGNPVSVINDHVATGNPNLFFKYDNRNRLIEFIQPFGDLSGNNAYNTWERYSYNSKDQIDHITGYGFGLLQDGVPQPGVYYFEADIKYDVQNRVIADTGSVFARGVFAYNYGVHFTYDKSGNLVRSYPGVVYDNKLNFHRTNKIWMFISRDYSVNNPFIATQYNDHGLPVVFTTMYMESFGIMAPSSGNVVVDYWCKDDPFTLPAK